MTINIKKHNVNSIININEHTCMIMNMHDTSMSSSNQLTNHTTVNALSNSSGFLKGEI